VGPFITFVIFAAQSEAQNTSRLTTPQIFSSLSIISLLTSPASSLLQSLPPIAMSTGCFERIQKFLLTSTYKNERVQITESDVTTYDKKSSTAISLDDVSIHFGDRVALSNINLKVVTGHLNVILGPIGSGKSTLFKSILGQVKPTSGSIQVSDRYMGYCSQAPWLPNGSVRDLICGNKPIDEDWYHDIKYVCAMDEDISNFPDQDNTIIGSRGITLSGGQKQRLVRTKSRDQSGLRHS
jgi:ATP-binding cassette subfamily C (CFTR/MRP) protein 1